MGNPTSPRDRAPEAPDPWAMRGGSNAQARLPLSPSSDRQRSCGQILAPPQSLHSLLMRRGGQIAAPPPSLHRLLSRWCGQMLTFLIRSSPRAGLPAAAPGPPSRDQLVVPHHAPPCAPPSLYKYVKHQIVSGGVRWAAARSLRDVSARRVKIVGGARRVIVRAPRAHTAAGGAGPSAPRAGGGGGGCNQLVTAWRSRSCSGKPRAG